MLRRLITAALALVFAATVYTSAALAQASQVPPAEVCFQATTGISGMIGTFGAIQGGLFAGTDGTYSIVPLTGGSGSGATANITVTGGIVTQVVLFNPGTVYSVGDSLSAAPSDIGGVSGFAVLVASVAINSSLAGGSVGMYLPGTLNFSQTWQDAAQISQNQNPIQLDGNGCALIYGQGTYRQIVYDRLGNVVWDRPTSVAPTSPFWAGLAGGTGNGITITDPSFAAVDGQSIQFRALNTNTGPTTLNGIIVLKGSSGGPAPLSGGEIAAGNVLTVTYVAATNSFNLLSYTAISAAMEPVVSASTVGAAAGLMHLAFGQAYFKPTSATTAALFPFNGSYITINGKDYSIPSGGVNTTITNCYLNGVAGQTLVANTLYYVYVFVNNNNLTLDFSTTSHSTDGAAANVGVEIMNGNSAYTLVGMVYPQPGPILISGAPELLVLSWFNRRTIPATNFFTTARTTTSSSFVEINSEIEIPFLTWQDEPVQLAINGTESNGTSGDVVGTAIGLDGPTPLDAAAGGTSTANNASLPVGISYLQGGISEGHHFATVLGLVSAGTGTWTGGAGAGGRTTLNVGVRG